LSDIQSLNENEGYKVENSFLCIRLNCPFDTNEIFRGHFHINFCNNMVTYLRFFFSASFVKVASYGDSNTWYSYLYQLVGTAVKSYLVQYLVTAGYSILSTSVWLCFVVVVGCILSGDELKNLESENKSPKYDYQTSKKHLN